MARFETNMSSASPSRSARRSSPAISATASGGSFRSSAAKFAGEGIKGTIFPVGADFQTIRPNGLTELEAKYAFEMDDGAVIYIENIGIRFGPKNCLTGSPGARPSIPR